MTLPAWLASTPLVVFDLETTGLEATTDRVIQIACLAIVRGQPISTWCSYVNPERPIPDEVVKLTGTKDSDVQHAPKFQDIAKEVAWRLGLRKTNAATIPVAYNGVHFDTPFVLAEIRRAIAAGAHVVDELTPLACLDPLLLVWTLDRYVPGAGRHRLVQACERHGVVVEKAHDALSDCWLTWRLLEKLGGRYDELGVLSLDDLWRWQAETARTRDADYAAWKAKQPKP